MARSTYFSALRPAVGEPFSAIGHLPIREPEIKFWPRHHICHFPDRSRLVALSPHRREMAIRLCRKSIVFVKNGASLID